MNNGKIRIYDLSKELNLENKELLAICETLNIAVKSHSSTITESEAENIRLQAAKLEATLSPRKERSTTTHKQNTKNINGLPKRPETSNKQQLLEIRQPKLENSATTNTNDGSAQTHPPSPPRPFATPVSPMKPTAPIRPTAPKQADTTSLTDSDKVKPAPEKTTAPAEKTVAEKPTPRPKPDKTPKPQLAAPPSRPTPEQTASPSVPPTSPVSKVEKPILKRDRPTGGNSPERREQSPGGKGKGQKAPGGEGNVASSKPSPANKPELKQSHPTPPVKAGEGQRSRPTRPSEAPEKVATPPRSPARVVDALDIGVIEPKDNILELKRPTPPRPVKGSKRWMEEEEEKEALKSSKAAIKSKRNKPILDDEFEEDLLDEDEGQSSIEVLVSNAIVRPPKPKSAKPAPTTATIAPKTRKSSGQRPQQTKQREPEVKRERPEILVVTGSMTVQELADALVIADTEIVKILFMKGMVVSITQSLDVQTINIVAEELGVEILTQEPEAEARKVTEMIDVADLDNLQRRPPVVTIMGHVDHGKTTLLDSIRKTKVAAGEAGGITQHIGAYHVDIEHNGTQQQIVFLDTPGHEAFTAMRARGARVTDIAVLVVAADDGVRPQTIEAISHAQAAEVPIVVAINKIDKESAQPDRVKQELTQYGLTPEEWGGETIMVPVSAITGENLDTLLEMILLVAEVAELSANPNRTAKGTVIEAHLDKAKGAVATLLIQNGTLRVGDNLVAGSVFGKVRAMVDDRGKRVEEATPSFAVEVLGLSDVPAAGDEFEVFLVEKEARAIAAERAEKQRQSRLMQGRVTLTSISAQAEQGELKELNLILKTDVQGSLEAIIGALRQIPQNEVQIRMLLSAAGEITQTDIDLAAASGAVIIGFNTTYASGARAAADEAGVDVREYNIIYKLLEDIQGALEGLLEPELVEEHLGIAEVRAVFSIGRGAVAGCYVQSGKLLRNAKIRVQRGGKVIYEGVLDSLKRMREDVREVSAGYECGVGVDKFTDWQEGDSIEAYQMVTKRRTLTNVAR